MSQPLLSKISAVRAKHSSVALGTGVALAVTALILGLAAGMLLDWWLDLPRFVRAAFLAIDIAMLITLLVMHGIWPIVTGPDDDQIALKVEDANPQFGTRLIAAIQLSRPDAVPAGASRALVQATVVQAESIAHAVDFTAVIRTERLIKLCILAALVVIGGLTAMVYGHNDNVSTDLLARAFLSNTPVPRKTRLEIMQPHSPVGRGDNVVLGCRARGVVPDQGEFQIRFDSDRKQSFPVGPTPEDRSAFSLKLENVQDSFEWRVRKLGDSTSEWYRVDVLTPPAVTQLDVQQVFPAYTKRGTVSRSLGDLSILTGSRLILKVTSNNPIQPDGPTTRPANIVHLVNPETPADVPLMVDPKNPRQLTANVPMPAKTSGFSIHLHDVNDLRSKDPAVYRVDLVPDKEPTVRVTYPERKEELVTRIATLEIGFDAADDYGITAFALKYKIDEGAEQSVPLDISRPDDPQPKRLHNRYAWKIAKLTPRSTTQPTLEGSTIEYWLEATDNNDVSGPGKGASEHFSARVVSEAEKKAEILARIGASIQDVQRGVEDEEELHKKLGDLIQERKPQ